MHRNLLHTADVKKVTLLGYASVIGGFWFWQAHQKNEKDVHSQNKTMPSMQLCTLYLFCNVCSSLHLLGAEIRRNN